jgi:hypothetical protein
MSDTGTDPGAGTAEGSASPPSPGEPQRRPSRPRIGRYFTPEWLMVMATVFSAVAAGFSACAAFRFETAIYATASRQENATYTTALYVKEVDTIGTFLSTTNELHRLMTDLLEPYWNAFSKPHPARDVSGLATFGDKTSAILRDIDRQISVLQTQLSIISIFVPVELASHFFAIAHYFEEDREPFNHTLGYISGQMHVALTNPQQEIVIDTDALRTSEDNYNKLIIEEEADILLCIKPQLTTGRPITPKSELLGCKLARAFQKE